MNKILVSMVCFVSCFASASKIKETPDNSKKTDLHCILSSYRIKKPDDSIDTVKIKVCSKGSVKTEPGKKNNLSDRKSK